MRRRAVEGSLATFAVSDGVHRGEGDPTHGVTRATVPLALAHAASGIPF